MGKEKWKDDDLRGHAMKKEFTSNQTKELKKNTQLFLQQVKRDAKENERYIEYARNVIKDVQLIREAQESIKREITAGKFGEAYSERAKRLNGVLNAVVLSDPLSFQCKDLLWQYESTIMEKLKLIQPASGRIQWFFSGKETKESAVNAYNYLLELEQSEYYNKACECHQLLLEVNKNCIENVETDWKSNDDILKKKLDFLRAESKEMRDPTIGVLCEKYNQMGFVVQTAQKRIDAAKEVLQKTADKAISRIAYDELKKIPVEELNRSRSGLKTGVLAANGYTTIADVYATNVYQLSSIRGISQDSAYTIKDKTLEIAQAIIGGTRLKINYDNRIKEITEMLQKVYEIKPVWQAFNHFSSEVNSRAAKIDTAKEVLNKVGNGLGWLIISDKDKQKIYDQFYFLTNYYDEKLNPLITELGDVLEKRNSIDADEVWEDFRQNSIDYYNILDELLPGVLGNGDLEYGLPEELAREIQEECFFPDGLLCELRRYQEWGVKYILHQKVALLGDEMGLGKTIQAIAVMVSLRNTGETHFMVVCPASVLANWCREIMKHSKLKVIKIHGAGRSNALKAWIKSGGVAVTTYETTAYLKIDEQVDIGLLTVDEAHYIKNQNAARSKNVRALCEKCERILFMTGTALENKVDEMVSLVQVLRPDIARELEYLKTFHTAPKFREKLAPVYFRRKQSDVNNELPEKIEKRDYCILQPEEKEAYENAVLCKSYMEARRISWMMEDLEKSSKAMQLKDIVEEAMEENRKVIVFSFFLDTVHKVKALFGDKCTNPITGSISPERRQEIIDEFTEKPNKWVLVAQIQSGGTGLNIQAASVVVICEPQMKPSIENQAIARAHRMGQSRTVIVHRLLCENTIEERMIQRLEEKQKVFDEFADKSVAADETLEIDDTTFGNIIEEEIERIKEERGM